MNKWWLILCVLLTASCVSAKDIPAVLPQSDKTPPAKDKPVKVYIMSGQSNMVGFGRVSGSGPVYPSVYLSADPTVLPAPMPVGTSALLPQRIYQNAEGEEQGGKAFVYPGAYNPEADYSAMQPVKEIAVALGNVSQALPGVDGPHAVVVKAFVTVPIAGQYEAYAGLGDSTDAIVMLNNQEVYRKGADGKITLNKIDLETGKRYPLTITYRKGGPAAFWMKLGDLKGSGDLTTLVKDHGLFPSLMDKEGNWVARNDVTLCESYLDKNKFKGGRSTPLSATANGKHIGPELGFGFVMGTFHDEPVLLIKSDIGNRSLGWDCLAPGSKAYEFDGKMVPGYGGTGEDPEGKNGKPEKGWYAGKQYDEYTKAIRGVLDNFDTLYPQYKDQGYEVAGFVWWQGHKDGGSEAHITRYAQNMANLIKAWRKEFEAPEAKWVIATVAFSGDKMNENYQRIAAAQLSVSGETGKFPEFAGNVKTIDARPFWRTRAESPTGTGYHYNHNAETYMLTGDALGRAMVELYGGKTEPSPTTKRRIPAPDKAVSEMNPEEMARLIYEDTFSSRWSKDARKPTPQQFAKMAPALRPMILGDIIPHYAASAPRVPAYRRHGMSLTPILTGKGPGKPGGGSLTSQLDLLVSYYKAAGIEDYSWKPFGPDMKNASWHYFSFDPPEAQAKEKGGRNRKITLPAGMENWHTVDFDPTAAGWKTGTAPFGQNNGAMAPLRSGCSHPHCGCGIQPKTLWEKEVLLMRQTFAVPALKDDQRYRIVLGGSAHAFSGEGYEIYINGKLFAQAKSGHYKGKGGARGGYIYSDFLPELKSGKITVAVKGFLRYTGYRNKVSPPKGHLSVWLEAMTLPKVVLDLAGE